MFQADELVKIVAKAVLLGINCAFGATDVSSLPESALDLAGSWVTFPRPKTAIERRCPLWPETIATLRASAVARRLPQNLNPFRGHTENPRDECRRRSPLKAIPCFGTRFCSSNCRTFCGIAEVG